MKRKLEIPLICIYLLIVFYEEVQGHGMMLDPVSRSSRWRYNKSAPINYDDNGLFCGGFGVQWHKNNGKCGMCGDDFSVSKPRPNELGGKYGQGVITKHYSQAKTVQLGIKITTNHLGFFYFHLCNLDKFRGESEECFLANRISFADGSDKMYIGKRSGMINVAVVLPKSLSCKHCVLRWNYQGGNNWGPCGNGTSALGCGPQENFKGCADVSIAAGPHKAEWQNSIFKTSDDLSYVVFEPLDKTEIEPFDARTREEPDGYNSYEARVEKKEHHEPSIFDYFNRKAQVENNLDYGAYEDLEDEMPNIGANDILFEEEYEETPDEAEYSELNEHKRTFFNMISSILDFDKEEMERNALDEGLFDVEDF